MYLTWEITDNRHSRYLKRKYCMYECVLSINCSTSDNIFLRNSYPYLTECFKYFTLEQREQLLMYTPIESFFFTLPL